MQDRDVVAAIVAGEPEGMAEAYDRYAASLYAYCHSMLAGPEAAEAVRDTFLISVLKLDGLRDPDRLDAWLRAVARNECLRRLGPEDPEGPIGPEEPAGAAAALVPRSADPDELPAVTLPTELRGRVLTSCADNSPAGRAHRVSVTHRAGAFGPSGFPKAIGPAGPWWRKRVRRHRRLAAVVAVMAVLAAAAGITGILTAGGPQRSQASALGFGAGVVGLPSSATPPPRTSTPPRVSPASSPTHKAAPSASPPTSAPSVTVPAGAPSPVPPSATMTAKPSPTPSATSPSPSPSTSPAQGHLLAAPSSLLLTAAKGKAVSGFFVLTATGGPISEYIVKVPAAVAAKVTVSPSRGFLPAGGYAAVTVTVTSNVALNTYVTVEPGNLTIGVTLKIKA